MARSGNLFWPSPPPASQHANLRQKLSGDLSLSSRQLLQVMQVNVEESVAAANETKDLLEIRFRVIYLNVAMVTALKFLN